jgi:hypothetical protein
MSLSAMTGESKRWRDMAEEARAKGEAMKDEVARRTMKKVAEVYDRLAGRGDNPPPLAKVPEQGAGR